MKPAQLFVIRHGESAANLDKTLRGHTPDHRIELTMHGLRQCQQLGQRLEPMLRGSLGIWTSPYLRARQTMLAMCDSLPHLEWQRFEDPRLREQDWGNYYNEVEHALRCQALDTHSRFFYRMPDGESGADVFDRVSSFLEMLYRENTADTVLISTHGMTAMIFLMRLLHWNYEEYEKTEWFHNAGFVRFESQPCGEYTLTLDARTTT